MFKSVLLCFLFAAVAFGRKCIVPLGANTDSPLLFHQNGSFYPTEVINGAEVAIIPNKEYVILSCSPNNFIESPGVKKIIATCRNGNLTGGTLAPRGNLACNSNPIEEALADVPGCPEGKTSVRFGYVHPIDNAGHIIGEACYDTKDGRTIFAHIRLGGEEFTTMDIVDKNFFKQQKPELRYKANFMYAYFRKVYEITSLVESVGPLGLSYIPNFDMVHFVDSSLLRNIQLAPVNELTWNYLILNYEIMNFKGLKEDIIGLRENVDIYIGSHGVATIADAADEKIPLYLDGRMFPVPELIWMVVKNGNKATAFVVFNDPTLTEAHIHNNSLCNSKCDAIRWLKNTNYVDPSKGGIILCCKYEELKKSIEEIPELSEISELYV